VCRTVNPTTFMYRLSRTLGDSPSWNLQGLYRGYFTFLYYIFSIPFMGSVCVSDPKSFHGQRISGNAGILSLHLVPSTKSAQCPAVYCNQLNDVTVSDTHTHTHVIDNGALCQLQQQSHARQVTPRLAL
jgi:hypothetical protein